MVITSRRDDHIFLQTTTPAEDTSSSGDKTNERPCILFFITGNPGLISFYNNFLTQLSSPDKDPASVASGLTTRGWIVAGFSLAGFNIDNTTTNPSTIPDALKNEPFTLQDTNRTKPYSLQDQIGISLARLNALAEPYTQRDLPSAKRPVPVVLLGHSVGAYIALEIARLVRNQRDGGGDGPRMDIKSLILLTPTVHNIRFSPSGRIAAPALGYLPFLPAVAQAVVNGISRFVPKAVVRSIVAWLMGRDLDGEVVETIEKFLGSKKAVNQALSMAAEEIKEIGDSHVNEWLGQDEMLWLDANRIAEAASLSSERKQGAPQIYMLFAHEDHWVAEETRAEVINALSLKTGQQEDGKLQEQSLIPKVVIEKPGSIRHAWCLDENETATVLSHVRRWIGDSLHLGG